MKSAPLSPKLEKAPEQWWRLSAAKKKKEKEWNLAICYNVDETWGHYAKWNKSEKEKYCMITLRCGILFILTCGILETKAQVRYRE